MSPYNLPSVTRSLFRDHLSLLFALLWNIPCRFSITIVLYIISSLHIVLILCARVGWCDIGSDFTNLIKVDPRNNWQLCTCSARFITLTDMCSFCWQKCGSRPTDFSISSALYYYWLSTWGTSEFLKGKAKSCFRDWPFVYFSGGFISHLFGDFANTRTHAHKEKGHCLPNDLCPSYL